MNLGTDVAILCKAVAWRCKDRLQEELLDKDTWKTVYQNRNANTESDSSNNLS